MNPIAFELTQAEVDVATARAAWRLSLRDGLLSRHLAPLAAFILAVLFIAVLGWTGLVPQRAAETGLILAAAAYMAYRLWTRRRFFAARRTAVAWGDELKRPTTLTLDEAGFRRQAGGRDEAWRFDTSLEVEAASGLIYVWPATGMPLVWPARAHSDAAEAEAWLQSARRRAGQTAIAPPPDDDD